MLLHVEKQQLVIALVAAVWATEKIEVMITLAGAHEATGGGVRVIVFVFLLVFVLVPIFLSLLLLTFYEMGKLFFDPLPII